MELIFEEILKYVFEVILFLILMVILTFIIKKIKERSYRVFNPKEYFPDEEIHSLKQIFYLIMMGLFFINVLYSLVFVESDIIYMVIYDILLSLYLAVKLDKRTLKDDIILLLLIPYGSLTYIIFGSSLVGLMDLIHIPVFIYFIIVYYDKFREYTLSNGLGITIILLFSIVFISFFVTQIFEGVNPLDALVMVSNSFTSNGYAVLGSSILGKIDAIVLVWAGYLLSGVGTATLTTAILINHYSHIIKGYDEKFEDLDNKFEELKDLIKENKKE